MFSECKGDRVNGSLIDFPCAAAIRRKETYHNTLSGTEMSKKEKERK